MRRRAASALVVSAALAGCAAGGAMQAPTQAQRPEAGGEAKKPAEFERIVSSFQVHPEALVYLTPAEVEHLERCDETLAVEAVADRFAFIGDVRGEAAARLDLGALYWCDGRGDDAYLAVMQAEALFTRAADLDGVARAHEWLGFMFLENREEELAAEHLAAAYQVFLRLADAPSTARVLAYSE